MPPLPSRPTIRYRPSSRVPGAKRPWLIESDDASHPLSEFGAAAGVGVRRLTTPIGPLGAGLVGCAPTAIVTASSAASAAPHEGQKRAASGAWLPQLVQVTSEFYRRARVQESGIGRCDRCGYRLNDAGSEAEVTDPDVTSDERQRTEQEQ